MTVQRPAKLLFDSSDWTFDRLRAAYDAIEDVALNDLGLDIYPNQIEIISSEQMLDAYSSVGMPLMYRHWSFGKRFVRESHLYRKGFSGLAYEIVINSNPCISYNMEESSMAMQTLVMAHAAFGHNHFFKNNYLFRQWTDAEAILEYLNFAKGYIAQCEERHGPNAVEAILDAAHALMDQGVFRYQRPPKSSAKVKDEKRRDRLAYEEAMFRDIWRTVPVNEAVLETEGQAEISERQGAMQLPAENLLYFLEKNSPALEPWQREVLRIVRCIAQYFYPQKQTKVMNEGCATFVHYTIINTLYDQGRLSEGAMLEMLDSHASVVFQPDFDDPRHRGINPYALGFEMMQDIKRICVEPTDEDREWFPEIAGCGDWRGTLRHAWASYRDESFIQQYLSPHVMRKFKLFSLTDDEKQSHYKVKAIHDERGYKEVRAALARSYDIGYVDPHIQVVDADMRGDRALQLEHLVRDGIALSVKHRDRVLGYVGALWGYDVHLVGIDADSGKEVYRASSGDKGEDA